MIWKKTPASERVGQGYSSRRNGATLRRQRPRKPAPRQMKDELAVANFNIDPADLRGTKEDLSRE